MLDVILMEIGKQLRPNGFYEPAYLKHRVAKNHPGC